MLGVRSRGRSGSDSRLIILRAAIRESRASFAEKLLKADLVASRQMSTVRHSHCISSIIGPVSRRQQKACYFFGEKSWHDIRMALWLCVFTLVRVIVKH